MPAKRGRFTFLCDRHLRPRDPVTVRNLNGLRLVEGFDQDAVELEFVFRWRG
jgi:hypothetical protein